MRLKLVVLAVAFAALILPLGAAAAAPFKVTFTASKHTPKVNERWNWKVAVTDPGGKPLPAMISAVVIDPVGGVHPVEFGCCATKFVTNVKIKGSFSDWVKYPLAAKGFKITFKVTVKTALGTRAVTYWVQTL